MSKIRMLILNKDESVTVVKLKRRDINKDTITYNDFTYLLPKQALHSTNKLFGRTSYLIYNAKVEKPIMYSSKLTNKEKSDISLVQMIIRNHIVRDILASNNKQILMWIVFLVMGLFAGLALGIVLAPHLLSSFTSNPTSGIPPK